MALPPGTRFGPYETAAVIGVGGMGEVYRARDLNLKRDVAIKVLPPFFSGDEDRLTRFQREAETLAALNHQNIAHIYGLERADGMTALVMELVDGPTLAERLAHGALPTDEALPIAMQIADALEVAHERGIVHRDLKPANIKLRPDGTVKVLDFGIAKVLQPLQAASGPHTAVANTPSFTQIGMILGTAAYMSPEQARGKSIDKRTDIWAFGCVLYEMLAGRPAFSGEDATAIAARVLERDVDMSALPATVPPSVRQVIAACLRKDPRKRLRDIGDAKLALEGAFETAPDAVRAPRRASRWVPITAALVSGAVAAGLAAWRLSPEPDAGVVTRLSESISVLSNVAFLSISADGGRVAWVDPSGIHVRRLDDFSSQPLPGVEDAAANRPPCFSPDGTWIAFRVGNQIKRMPVAGGPAVTLADGVAGAQCHWGDDGYVYFVSNNGIDRVPEAGGTHEAVAAADIGRGESAHFAPQLLPDRTHLLFSTAAPGESGNAARVVVLDLETGERKTVLERAEYVGYIALRGGDRRVLLVYVQNSALFTAPFDVARFEVGSGRPVLRDGMGFPPVRAAAVSRSGTLAYLPIADDALGDASLAWVGRDGTEQALPEPARNYGEVSLDPAGQRAVVTIIGSQRRGADLWLQDLDGNGLTRLTFDEGNVAAAWTPDSQRVVHAHSGGAAVAATGDDLQIVPIDDPRAAVTLVDSAAAWRRGGIAPSSVSPDGTVVMVTNNYLGSGDIWSVPLGSVSTGSDGEPRAFLATASDERDAKFSPSSPFVAYASDESGSLEIYVAPYPGPGLKWQVSRGGGTWPQWSADGRELFYMNGEQMMSAEVESTDVFRTRAPRPLFAFPQLVRDRGFPYSVAPDGTRFLMLKSNTGGARSQLNVVVNWLAEIEPVATSR